MPNFFSVLLMILITDVREIKTPFNQWSPYFKSPTWNSNLESYLLYRYTFLYIVYREYIVRRPKINFDRGHSRNQALFYYPASFWSRISYTMQTKYVLLQKSLMNSLNLLHIKIFTTKFWFLSAMSLRRTSKDLNSSFPLRQNLDKASIPFRFK